jgi:hypothetical protein
MCLRSDYTAALAADLSLIDMQTLPYIQLGEAWWDQNAIEELSIGGKVFFTTGDLSISCNDAVQIPVFNKTVFSKHEGLEDPYQLVRDGKWTVDKMTQMGLGVNADTNGDGVMTDADSWGYLAYPWGGLFLFFGAGESIVSKDENDLPILALDEERAIAAIEKLVPLFRDKDITLYSQDFTSAGYKNIFRDLIVQKFLEDEILFVNNWLCVALELRDMESDVGLLPPPKFEEQQENYMVYNSSSWTTYSAVPKTVKEENLNFIGDVMNALGYYGHEHIYTALIDTAITFKSLRDEGNKEMMELIYANRIFDLADIYDFGGISSMMNSFVSGNSTNFTSKYKSYSKIIEKQIQAIANAAG